MNKIYKEKYFNRRDYILDKINELGLNSQETVILLMIDYLNSDNTTITDLLISEKCNIDIKTTNTILYQLCQKGMLQIQTKRNKVEFNLDPLFEEKHNNTILSNIFDLFIQEFNRPLSQSETEKLGEWSRVYTNEQLINALKQAVIYKKINFSYIEKILNSDEK